MLEQCLCGEDGKLNDYDKKSHKLYNSRVVCKCAVGGAVRMSFRLLPVPCALPNPMATLRRRLKQIPHSNAHPDPSQGRILGLRKPSSDELAAATNKVDTRDVFAKATHLTQK
jgi:hypothetical protein